MKNIYKFKILLDFNNGAEFIVLCVLSTIIRKKSTAGEKKKFDEDNEVQVCWQILS